MASAPRNSPRPPAYQICVDDRASFLRQFNTLFAEGALFITTQSPLWLALQRLVAEIPGAPAIVVGQFFSAETLETRTLEGEGFFRKFLSRYLAESPRGMTEVVLTLQVDLEVSQIFLESVQLNRPDTELYPVRSDVSAHQRAGGAIDFPVTGEGIIEMLRLVVESFQSRQQESQHITHFDVRPGIHLRVDRNQSERDRQCERRENERIRSLGGMIQLPLFGYGAHVHPDSRWSAFNELGWDMLDRAEQAESTRRLNEILSGRKSSTPTACQGCANYYGKTHGGNTLICAMHPHGAGSDSCADFEGATSEA
jgi:hypothetical protein